MNNYKINNQKNDWNKWANDIHKINNQFIDDLHRV